MNTIYPIGSLYFGTQSTCPLQSAGIGTWTRIATNFVTGSTAPVIGNGKALGITNGTNTFQLGTSNVSTVSTLSGGTYESGNLPHGSLFNDLGGWDKAIGVTTDPEKSGLIADLPTYTVNVWRRTA